MTTPTPRTPERRLKQAREWKRKNADRIREYNASRAALIASDPELKAKKLAQNRESAKRNYDKRLEYDRARSAEKKRARALIRHMIEEGQLQRGECEVCGLPEAQAHHDDYSRPRDIRWLCPKHHKEVHANERK